MKSLLDGKKTYIGLAVALVGVLGVANFISEAETAALLDHLFEVVGILIAVYGRYVAKAK